MTAKEAILYQKLPGERVKCTACARYCDIGKGQIGLCGIRANNSGRLDLLAYGKVIASHIDPIEKKPVTHYKPGTSIFSIATTGCNWLCKYCQNFDISQRRKIEGNEMTPSQVVELAKNSGTDGIAYTYNEPSIFIEFAHDCGLLAREKGLFNIFVSNGYDTPDTVGMMDKFLDCITIDFKGNAEPNFSRKYIGIPDTAPIFDTLRELKRKTKIHVEITDLVVPKVGDDTNYARKLCKFIYDEFGPDIPIHFLRFHPDYKMMEFEPTSTETLEKHHKIAKQEGLNYAYVGNVPGHPLEHTYCPQCKNIVVKRYGFDIQGWYLDQKNKCNFCGAKISIEGKLSEKYKQKRFQFVF